MVEPLIGCLGKQEDACCISMCFEDPCEHSSHSFVVVTSRQYSVPFFLKIAASTQRLLVIQWTKPAALEEFLVPPMGGIDWRVYPGVDVMLQKSSIKVGTQDTILQYAVQQNATVLQVKFQSHDHGAVYYDKYRESMDEVDFNIIFHTVWNILFTPSIPLSSSIDDTMRNANIRPGQYTAAHLRALYLEDKRTISMVQGWTQNAVNCAFQLQQLKDNRTVYFAADSDKALQYAISYGKIFNVDVVTPAKTYRQDPLHLDKTPDWQLRPPADFYDAFIDLYIMSLSNGVAYGMGGYGRFAALMSKNFNHSMLHMSATFNANCSPPPRRRRRSGLHNYFKKKDAESISNVFVLPMPPAKIISRSQIRIIQHHDTKPKKVDNKAKKIDINVKEEILFPDMTRTNRSQSLWDESHKLPKWMKDYFVWHREQRKQITQYNWLDFKFIIMTCLQGDATCGGASDRLRPLPFLVRVAAETKRVLLINWDRPALLESFLLPPAGGVDWRTPKYMVASIRSDGVKASSVARLVDVAAGMEKIVKSSIQSHDHGSEYYNSRGELTGDGPSSFRKHYRDCWFSFFTPVLAIAKAIEDELVRMDLIPGEFAVAHLRSEYDIEPGRHRDPLLLQNWTVNALNCISGLRPDGPFFFSSDSSEAKKIAVEYGKYRNAAVATSDYTGSAPLHLDMALSTRAQDPVLFFPTFIDLYLMSMGRCYTYNVGGFGKWANLISGRDFTCNIRHWTDGVNKISAKKDGCQWTDSTNNAKPKSKATKIKRLPMFLLPVNVSSISA